MHVRPKDLPEPSPVSVMGISPNSGCGREGASRLEYETVKITDDFIDRSGGLDFLYFSDEKNFGRQSVRDVLHRRCPVVALLTDPA